MTEVQTSQFNEQDFFIEEKGDLEHAIRCAEQAEQRAEPAWLKRACAFRVKMLRLQLSKRNQI